MSKLASLNWQVAPTSSASYFYQPCPSTLCNSRDTDILCPSFTDTYKQIRCRFPVQKEPNIINMDNEKITGLIWQGLWIPVWEINSTLLIRLQKNRKKKLATSIQMVFNHKGEDCIFIQSV